MKKFNLKKILGWAAIGCAAIVAAMNEVVSQKKEERIDMMDERIKKLEEK